MKRNYAGYSYPSTYMLWSDLATKTLEMMLTSAQVIGHRTGRMTLAFPAPNLRDRREFTLMGQEKIEAGAQSAQAMAAHIDVDEPAVGRVGFPPSPAKLGGVHVVSQQPNANPIARQAALAQAVAQSAISMADVSKNATKLAHRGLKPIHAKATANARRLGKH